MNYEQSTYSYYRSKSIIEDEKMGSVFLGFVSLSILNIQRSENVERQKLIKGPGFYKECPVNEVPFQLKKLPNKDTHIILTKSEYELLEKNAGQDELAFWLYRTALS